MWEEAALLLAWVQAQVIDADLPAAEGKLVTCAGVVSGDPTRVARFALSLGARSRYAAGALSSPASSVIVNELSFFKRQGVRTLLAQC